MDVASATIQVHVTRTAGQRSARASRIADTRFSHDVCRLRRAASDTCHTDADVSNTGLGRARLRLMMSEPDESVGRSRPIASAPRHESILLSRSADLEQQELRYFSRSSGFAVSSKSKAKLSRTPDSGVVRPEETGGFGGWHLAQTMVALRSVPGDVRLGRVHRDDVASAPRALRILKSTEVAS